VDVPSIGAVKSLFGLLISSMKAIGAGNKAEIRSIKNLTDRKLAEIQRTHKLFMSLMRRLSEAAMKAHDAIPDTEKTLRVLEQELKGVTRERRKQQDDRRKHYEEANVYAAGSFEEHGVFNKVPDDIALALQQFMQAFVEYFSSDAVYQHNLGNTIRFVEETSYELKAMMKSNRPERDLESGDGSRLINSAKNRLKTLKEMVDVGLRMSEDRWAKVTNAYFRLNRAFMEHGLIATRK
jgi:hypothetical protein